MARSFTVRTARGGLTLAGALAVLALGAGAAAAQTLSTNSASFNGGYGRYAGTENQGFVPDTGDANGNRVVVDGLIVAGSGSYSSASGAAYASAGVSAGGSATAIGNSLNVVTTGNYNTVIVNSTQINNGNVTANSNSSVSTLPTGGAGK